MRCRVIPRDGRGRAEESDFESFVAPVRRGATAQISFGRTTGRAGAKRPGSCRRPASRSTPSAGPPGSRCPSGSSGPTPAGTHEERLPLEPTVGDVLNDQFHRLVRGRPVARPDDPRRPGHRPARPRPPPQPDARAGVVVSIDREQGATPMREGRPTDGTTATTRSRDHCRPRRAPAGRCRAMPWSRWPRSSGLGLMVDSLGRARRPTTRSMYLRSAADGGGPAIRSRITRMGSPLTFWKLQQVPVLWCSTASATATGSTTRSARGRPPAAGAARRRSGSGWRRSAWSRLEPPALRPARDGAGRLAVRAEPEPAGARPARHDGDPDPRGDDRRCSSSSGCSCGRATAGPSWPRAVLGGLAFSCKFTAVLVPPILGAALVARPLERRRPPAGPDRP